MCQECSLCGEGALAFGGEWRGLLEWAQSSVPLIMSSKQVKPVRNIGEKYKANQDTYMSSVGMKFGRMCVGIDIPISKGIV